MKATLFQLEVGSSLDWSRKLLHAYWVFAGVSLLLEIGNLFFTMQPKFHFVFRYAILPTILVLIVNGICEFVFRYFHRVIDYCLITAAVSLAVIMITVHNQVPVIYVGLFLPGLVSVFFFENRKVLVAYSLSIIAYLALFMVQVAHHEGNAGDCFTMLGELGLAWYLTKQIMQRGIVLVSSLKDSVEAQQELLVRTTVMERLSKTDLLTGLYNHLTFHEYLEGVIEQCEPYGIEIQLAVLDIDNFKQINDTFGHRCGDLVLKHVAECITRLVTADDFVSRYGGEEFAIIFTDKPMERVYELLEKIREAIASETYGELNNNHVTISIGVNRYSCGLGKEGLFRGADRALYKAKTTGKNQTVPCLEEM